MNRQDKRKEIDDNMTIGEGILAIIFFITLMGTCWLFLLITYNI